MVSGSVSSIEDPAIAELLFGSSTPSTTTSSLLSFNFRRGQQFVLHEEPGGRRRSRLNLGRLYRNTVSSEVAGIGSHLNGCVSSSGGGSDIKLLGYQKIVDNSLECIEIDQSKPVVTSNGRLTEDREDFDIDADCKPLRTSLLSLTTAETSNPSAPQRLHVTEKLGNRASRHQLEHAISTPNLGSALPIALDISTADSLAIERCPRCGLPDLSVITTTAPIATTPSRKHGRSSSIGPSVSLPSLLSLDPTLLSPSAGGAQTSGNIRPTMRRLKHQHRHKAAIFTRKRNSK